MIVGMLGYKVGESRSLRVPGEKFVLGENEEPLSSSEATSFRAIVARAKYLAQDRSDIMFAVKELTRHMAQPTVASQTMLKRLGRYLLGAGRVSLQISYQRAYKHVDVWTDSDWAGDRLQRKCTSGGVVRLGNHCVTMWSSTEKSIALSSGEAEITSFSQIGFGRRFRWFSLFVAWFLSQPDFRQQNIYNLCFLQGSLSCP